VRATDSPARAFANSTLADRPVVEDPAGLLPGVKLLAVLRDPVDRAYSQFNMSAAKPTIRSIRSTRRSRQSPSDWVELARVEAEMRLQQPDRSALSLTSYAALRRARRAFVRILPREQSLFFLATRPGGTEKAHPKARRPSSETDLASKRGPNRAQHLA